MSPVKLFFSAMGTLVILLALGYVTLRGLGWIG